MPRATRDGANGVAALEQSPREATADRPRCTNNQPHGAALSIRVTSLLIRRSPVAPLQLREQFVALRGSAILAVLQQLQIARHKPP